MLMLFTFQPIPQNSFRLHFVYVYCLDISVCTHIYMPVCDPSVYYIHMYVRYKICFQPPQVRARACKPTCTHFIISYPQRLRAFTTTQQHAMRSISFYTQSCKCIIRYSILYNLYESWGTIVICFGYFLLNYMINLELEILPKLFNIVKTLVLHIVRKG